MRREGDTIKMQPNPDAQSIKELRDIIAKRNRHIKALKAIIQDMKDQTKAIFEDKESKQGSMPMNQ